MVQQVVFILKPHLHLHYSAFLSHSPVGKRKAATVANTHLSTPHFNTSNPTIISPAGYCHHDILQRRKLSHRNGSTDYEEIVHSHLNSREHTAPSPTESQSSCKLASHSQLPHTGNNVTLQERQRGFSLLCL